MTENEAPSKCRSNDEENDKIDQKTATSEVKISINDDANKESIEVSSEMIEPHKINKTEAIKNRELDKIPDVLIKNHMKATRDVKTITVYMEYPYQQHQYPQQQYPQQPYGQQQQYAQPYAQQGYPQYPPQYQEEYRDPGHGYNSFEYTPDKNGFIRKVFFLVFLMLSVTAIITYLVYTRHDIQKLMKHKGGKFSLIIASVVLAGVNYTFCLSNCTRRVPCNFIVIIIGTLAYSYIVSFTTSLYKPQVILGAVGSTTLTALVCLGLAFTSFDFTKFLLIILVASVALALSMLACALLKVVLGTKLTLLMLVLLCLSAVVSSVTLVIELQMILGGKSIEIEEDDYAYAAYLVYTSLIDLFIKILQIINGVTGLLGDNLDD